MRVGDVFPGIRSVAELAEEAEFLANKFQRAAELYFRRPDGVFGDDADIYINAIGMLAAHVLSQDESTKEQMVANFCGNLIASCGIDINANKTKRKKKKGAK